MKKTFKTLLVALCTVFAIGAYAEKNVETLIVNIPSHVYIYEGDSLGISIRTADQAMYDMINYTIEDSIIKIDIDKIWMIEDQMIDPDDVRINIVTPNSIKNIKTNSYLLVAESKNKKATTYDKN